jgi:hypothetical protein
VDDMRGDILEWIKTYLSDRKEKVVLNNTESEIGCLYAGVPQGSVLGSDRFVRFLKNCYNVSKFQKDGKHCFLRDKLNSFLSGRQIVFLVAINIHEHDTVYKFEDQEKAQLLNDYFCSIATLDNDNKDIPYMTDRGPDILTEIKRSICQIS